MKLKRQFAPISPTELLIMKHIWKTAQGPQKLREIADNVAPLGLTYNTVKGLLPKLVNKGLLSPNMIVTGRKQTKFHNAYTSTPGGSLESRLVDEIDDIAERLLDSDATGLVVKLIEDGHVDKPKIQEASSTS
jgi:predicted transcriptional regulator